jgi:hypothetical protein
MTQSLFRFFKFTLLCMWWDKILNIMYVVTKYKPIKHNLFDWVVTMVLIRFFDCIGHRWYSAGLRLDDRGFESLQGLGIFLFTTVSMVSYPMGNRVSFPGLKRPGREADHSLLSSAEVKNVWKYTSTPQYAFVAWCSVKAQGQLYLYLQIVSDGGGDNEWWIQKDLEGGGSDLFLDIGPALYLEEMRKTTENLSRD